MDSSILRLSICTGRSIRESFLTRLKCVQIKNKPFSWCFRMKKNLHLLCWSLYGKAICWEQTWYTWRKRVCFWDTRFWAGHFAALSTPTLPRRAYAWEATFPTFIGSNYLWNTSVQFTEVHHCILFASSGTKCWYLCFEPHICQVVFQETSMEYVYYTGILNVTA